MPRLARARSPLQFAQKLTRLQRFAVLALAFLAALWLVENWVGEAFWPVLIATYLPQQPVLALPLFLLGLSLWKRDYLAAAISGAALFFAAWTFVGVRAPVLRSASRAWSAGTSLPPPRLRVLTFNLNRGGRGVPGLIRAIRAQNPDVVCLQETRRSADSAALYEEVRAQLPDFSATATHEVAIFSRHPVLGQRVTALRQVRDRAILETTIGFEGQRVRIFSVHVTAMDLGALATRDVRTVRSIVKWDSLRRQGQFDALLAQCERSDGPAIVCGDFNTPPRGRLYRRMRSRFTDCFDRAGWGAGNTFTSELPLLRIDYIWASPQWRVERCFTSGGAASDHQAVVADLVLG